MNARQTELLQKIEDAYAVALASPECDKCCFMEGAKEHLRVALSNMICLKLRAEFRNPPPEPKPSQGQPDADDDSDDDDTDTEADLHDGPIDPAVRRLQVRVAGAVCHQVPGPAHPVSPFPEHARLGVRGHPQGHVIPRQFVHRRPPRQHGYLFGRVFGHVVRDKT